MKKLSYAEYMRGDYSFGYGEEEVVLANFKNDIEMTVDENGRIYDEAGIYIANLLHSNLSEISM